MLEVLIGIIFGLFLGYQYIRYDSRSRRAIDQNEKQPRQDAECPVSKKNTIDVLSSKEKIEHSIEPKVNSSNLRTRELKPENLKTKEFHSQSNKILFEQEDSDEVQETDPLTLIRKTELKAKKPINGEAYLRFHEIQKSLLLRSRKYQLFAEVQLAAFICSRNYPPSLQAKKAFNSFQFKRLDFLIIDAVGEPAVAIEYDGTGHFQGDENKIEQTKLSDRMKELVFEKADIEFLRIDKTMGKEKYLLELDEKILRFEEKKRSKKSRF